MRKIISLIVSLSMILGLCNIVFANATFSNAEIYDIGTTVNGVISETNSEMPYFLNLSDAGTITINYIGENIESAYLKIYNEVGQEIWSERPSWNSTSKQISYTSDVELTAGDYYFVVSKRYGEGTYNLKINFKSAGESFPEEQNGSNNTFNTASEINVDEEYTGQIAVNDEIDNYKFTLESSGCIQLQFLGQNIESPYLKIYTENGQEIWSERPSWNSTSKQISYSADVELTTGTYYFTASKRYGYGNYDLTLEYKSAEESFPEEQNGSNNTFNTAAEINVDEEYTGQIAINDEIDNYIFTLSDAGCVNFEFTAQNIESPYLKFYTNNGQEIWSERPSWNSTSKQISYTSTVELTAGTYYFIVSKRYGYGTYNFILNYTSSQETFAEEQNGSNNTFNDAEEININTEYKGQIAINDEIDNYCFSISSSDIVHLQFTANNIESPYLKIYTENGQEIWSERPSWNSTSKQISFNGDITLESGVYYFTVSKRYGYGDYKFNLLTNNTYRDEPRDEPEDEPIEDNELTSFDSKVSEWAKDEVEEAYENDLIPETIIGEDLTEHITRAEFAAIAVQLYEELSGIHPPADETPFVDVDWNENIEYINKAYVLGITSGTSKTTFSPDIDITREQLATMLCRAIKKYSFDGWTPENDSDYYLDTSGVPRFADDDEISEYAKPSVYYMTKFGIISGVGDNKFAPRNITSYQESTGYATATREQAILMSLRIFNVSEIW